MNIRRTLAITLAGLGVTAIAAPQAMAWDGVVTGAVAYVAVTDGGSMGFRATLVGVGPHCTGGQGGYAYLNDTDSNYKVYVGALLVARALGTSVTLYTTKVGSYCKIGFMVW